MISSGFHTRPILAQSGTLILLAALLTPSGFGQSRPPQRPPDDQQVIATNQRSFKIPFSIGQRSNIVQVVLNLSTDRGRTWQAYQRQNASADGFPFQCQEDGEYWFALQTVDRNGVVSPARVYRPQMAIVVDTAKPEFEFEVRPDAAGRVLGQWSAADPLLQANSLIIQYRGADEEGWKNVPTDSAPHPNEAVFQNQLAWWPQVSNRALVVRAQISDAAGNATGIERQIVMPQVAGAPATSPPPVTPGGGDNSGSPSSVQAQAEVNGNGRRDPARIPAALAGSTRRTRVESSPTSAAPPQPSEASKITWPSTSLDHRPSTVVAQNSTTSPAGGNATQERPFAERGGNRANIDRERTSLSSANTAVNVGSTSSSNPPAIANSPPGAFRRQQTQTTVNHATPATEIPSRPFDPGESPGPQSPISVLTAGQLQDIKGMARPLNSDRFQIEYEVDAIGPDGIKTVEVWMTRDGGHNWRRWATDDDRRSPVDIQVDGEGIFGFRVVIISNDGLRAKPPQRGDAADMWVHVDMTNPVAQITGAPFGREQQAGRLLIQWSASDPNLMVRPVKLQYSPRPDGPWTTIVAGVDNTGTFAWKPEAGAPDQVFLRLEVRDEAGNVTATQLDRPIDISGLAPRGHIRDITPIGRSGN